MEITVNNYFAAKSEQYDDVDLQPYWTFSDELLWFLLQSLVLPKKQDETFKLFDAGAGTARWSAKTLEAYRGVSANLVDISPEMLSVAKRKLKDRGLDSRADVRVGDVRECAHIDDESVDVVYCLHNVIGFFDDTISAIQNFHRVMKKGGKCAVMFPSYYHALYFSNVTGRVAQFEQIRTARKVQYNDQMPPLKVFEIPEIKWLQEESCFSSVSCYGFPLTVYPGMEETFVHGSSKSLVKLFVEPYRSQLLKEEKKLCLQSDLASRGNNILAVFEK